MQVLVRLILVVAAAAWQYSQAASYSHVINEGAWRTETSPFECRLISAVPFYGNAVFGKVAGDDQIRFYLEATTARLAAGEAQLRAEAPVWNTTVGSVVLGEVAVQQTARPINLDQQHALAILAQLTAGREVVIAPSTGHGDDEERLVMTSVAFRTAYNAYLDCLSGLLPANFTQLKRTSIYFKPGEREELPEDQLEKLDQILLYAEADPYLREIYIDGHTDSTGLRDENLALSEARARLVRDYLVKRGMPQERIVLRWHGERYPVTGNDTAVGRNQNRRVTLRLERVKPVEIPALAGVPGSN